MQNELCIETNFGFFFWEKGVLKKGYVWINYYECSH